MIVTTEKDAVRLKGLKPEGIWALRIELDVLEKAEWETLLMEQDMKKAVFLDRDGTVNEEVGYMTDLAKLA